MGDTYLISGLVTLRRELTGQIIALEDQAAEFRKSVAHVDAVLRLVDPAFDLERVPPKRVAHRSRYFGSQELSRMLREVLRDMDGRSAGIAEIGDAVMTRKGMDQTDDFLRPRVHRSVWAGLDRLAKRGRVERSGYGKQSLWKLAEREPGLPLSRAPERHGD
jgi:hypothetical protein